jgi:spore coat polysaccharide biosynthesis protein SpsF (cytidylyltransferase family)
VMRVTGDCPLFAPDVANLVLRTFLSGDAPYVWNDTAATGWPDGTDVEVMTMAALNEAKHAHSASPADREHVTPWIRRTRGAGVVAAERDWSELKLSVDTAPDLDRVRAIMAHVPPGRWDLVDTVRAAKRAGMLNSPAGVGT